MNADQLKQSPRRALERYRANIDKQEDWEGAQTAIVVSAISLWGREISYQLCRIADVLEAVCPEKEDDVKEERPVIQDVSVRG